MNIQGVTGLYVKAPPSSIARTPVMLFDTDIEANTNLSVHNGNIVGETKFNKYNLQLRQSLLTSNVLLYFCV